jgi:hypothetical protein
MSLDIRDHINADTVSAALRLPDRSVDNRVLLTIDWDGTDFRDTWCDIHTNIPAAVHVDYTLDQGDEHENDCVTVEAAYSLSTAADALAAILDDENVIDDQIIAVRVNAHAFVYSLNAQVAA